MNAERRQARQLMAFEAAMTIRKSVGALNIHEDIDTVRVATLGAIAETRALFTCLIHKGLITQAEYEDYLDAGYRLLLDQVNGKANQIFVTEPGRG